jgi:hypothetical protein
MRGRIHEQAGDLGQVLRRLSGGLEQVGMLITLGQADLAGDRAVMLGHPGRDLAGRAEPADGIGRPASRVAAAVVNAAQHGRAGLKVARLAGTNRHDSYSDRSPARRGNRVDRAGVGQLLLRALVFRTVTEPVTDLLLARAPF